MRSDADDEDEERAEVEEVDELSRAPRRIPEGPRERCRWTTIEDDTLTFEWGVLELGALARMLRRTEYSISERAKRLKLGPPSRAARSMRELVRVSGYDELRIRAAITALDIRLQKAKRQSPKQRIHTARYAITEEQEGAIIAYLAKIPDGPFYSKGTRSTRGEWGTGNKPARCHFCSLTIRLHYAKGLCSVCYNGRFNPRPYKYQPDFARWQDDGGK